MIFLMLNCCLINVKIKTLYARTHMQTFARALSLSLLCSRSPHSHSLPRWPARWEYIGICDWGATVLPRAQFDFYLSFNVLFLIGSASIVSASQHTSRALHTQCTVYISMNACVCTYVCMYACVFTDVSWSFRGWFVMVKLKLYHLKTQNFLSSD